MLKIVVCVKAVPDPQEADKIKIDPLTKTLVRHEIPLVINPLDRNALEAALNVKERSEAHITILSMGPPEAGNIVKECLALGADEGILLTDRAFAGADAFATAFTLAAAVKKVGLTDLIFCGMASSDGSTEWVGPELAIMLDFSVVTMVSEIIKTEVEHWDVKADIENGHRIMQVDLPALFSVTRNLNTPRSLSFSGIIKSRSKEITEWNAKDLELNPDAVGENGSPTIVTDMQSIESKRAAELFQGSLDEKATCLVDKLAEAGVL